MTGGDRRVLAADHRGVRGEVTRGLRRTRSPRAGAGPVVRAGASRRWSATPSVSAGATSVNIVSSVAGFTSGLFVRSRSKRVMVGMSGDQLAGVASTTPRVCDGASYAISARPASTRCTRRAGGPALSTSCSSPLSVATAGAAVPLPVVNTNGCAGVSGSTTGASDVSRRTNRPTSICVRRSTVASSTGSTNAVRGSGIWPVAALDRVRPRDVLLRQMGAEALRFDRRARDRYVRFGKQLRRRPGRGAPHSPDTALEVGMAARFAAPDLERLRADAEAEWEPAGAGEQRRDVVEPATRTELGQRGGRDLAIGPFERAGEELPQHETRSGSIEPPAL